MCIRDSGSIVSAPKTAAECYKKIKVLIENRQRESDSTQRLQTLIHSFDADFDESIENAWNSFMAPGSKQDPVPAVLFLDDAQWADPYDVSLLQRLLCPSSVRHDAPPPRPVLVLATYWPDVWNRDQQADPTQIKTVRDLFEILPGHTSVKTDEPIELSTLENTLLEPMVRKALPGVSAADRKVLLDLSLIHI